MLSYIENDFMLKHVCFFPKKTVPVYFTILGEYLQPVNWFKFFTTPVLQFFSVPLSLLLLLFFFSFLRQSENVGPRSWFVQFTGLRQERVQRQNSQWNIWGAIMLGVCVAIWNRWKHLCVHTLSGCSLWNSTVDFKKTKPRGSTQDKTVRPRHKF